MPISSTVRALDNGHYTNADGLKTDRHGIPLNPSDNFKSYDGDPNGNVEITGKGICFGIGSNLGAVYIKQTDGTSSSEWTLLIGA